MGVTSTIWRHYMAAKTATKGKAASKKTAPPPADEELELDAVGEDEVEEAPAKVPEVTFGASDLAAYLSETAGKTVTARELRTLIRKMARDGTKRVNREITPGNRTRYDWSGVDDPEVKAIISAYEGGELEADKKAKLDDLKKRKAEKKAAGQPVGKKARAKAAKEEAAATKASKKKKAAPVEVEDDDDLDLDDDDD
jgi:hypothetical protein